MKIFKGFPEQEVKNDLMCTYSEIKEARGVLADSIYYFPKGINSKEYIEKLEWIDKKLENAEHWLRKYLDSDDQVLYDLK